MSALAVYLKALALFLRWSTENAGTENGGPKKMKERKMQDQMSGVKMQDLKMRDQMSGVKMVTVSNS